jgi:hypothetical protein
MRLNSHGEPGNWAKVWVGHPIPVQNWYLACVGKRSLRPGLVCSGCRVEFDDEQRGLKLVNAGAGTLASHSGETHSLTDWHRVASGLLTSAEESLLWDEVIRLQANRQREQAQFEQAQRDREAGLVAEFVELYRQSILGGYADFKLEAPRVRLKSGETPRWECRVERWKVRTSDGYRYWSPDTRGYLVVTTERVLFDAPGSSLWQRPLEKLTSVTLQHTSSATVLVLEVLELQKPIGFAIGDQVWEVTIDGRKASVTLTARDLEELIRRLR